MKAHKKSLAVVLGGTFAASLAMTPVVHAEHNPFAARSLGNGYMVAEADTKAADMPADGKAMEEDKMKDGKCATGKCGSSMKKKKAKAKAEAEVKAKDGNCSAEMKKDMEGNCSANK